ncbi:MAG TPA: sigma-70 family RNA polymerase sigma factor, partial [Candidatus Acidoferrum sp.]|nr:sigma-70 family RNA polymerase sigma factor [Candidatus Acidoferrum sp.]
MNENELLQALTDRRSEEAFAHLVRRYSGLVYSTAKRRLANASLAEDITQIVFIRFAKNPPKVKSPGELAAWLHRTTIHVTVDLWRSESRRRAREMEAVIMESAIPEPAIWEEISPKLDEALNQLDEDDRQALLLRFFSEKSMREVGAMLGVSEDAAKMRVSRALERLRTQMGTTATACTAAVLGTLLAEHSVEAVPASLISRLSALKLPAAAGVAGSLTAMIQQMSKFKLTSGIITAALLTLVSLHIHIIHSANKTVVDTASGIAQTNPVTDQTANTDPADRHSINSPNLPQASAPPEVAMLFHVTDSETGQPLENAQIHFAYFSAGGNAEGRSLMTDSNGTATILEPKGTTENCNLNVFVVAEGHVPEAIQFHTMPADYSIKLDPAMTVSGMVEDEQGRPVSGVEILVQNP